MNFNTVSIDQISKVANYVTKGQRIISSETKPQKPSFACPYSACDSEMHAPVYPFIIQMVFLSPQRIWFETFLS
jgi:hypothetical protein